MLGPPAPTAFYRVRVGDAFYLPRRDGGWDVRDTRPEDLMSEALRRAWAARRPSAGLVSHSDQGRQYNAPAESFGCRFRAELLGGGHFPVLAEAKLEISHHIADYYAATPPSATTRPIPSTRNFKPRPSGIRLS